MKILYSRWDILAKLRGHLTPYFAGFTKPTTHTLIWIIIAMIAVGGVRSIRSLHTEFLAELDLVSLNSLYHALGYAKRPLKRAFIRMTVQLALKVIPPGLQSALCFLSVDDTLVPKFGRKFDLVGTLFDHADHDGRPYKNGHCMVCIALSVPVGYHRKTKQIIYLCMPLVLRIWEKGGPTKLEIAHDLLLEVKDACWDLARFVLLMDSWYPKAPLLRIRNEWKSLKLICAVRSDTALYDLPPGRTGKRGRPRTRGDRLNLTDFDLGPCGMDGYLAGRRPVLTNLFGTDQITAFVTRPASGNGSFRLYLSTLSSHEMKQLVSEAVRFCAPEHDEFVPLLFYRNRWAIEVVFFELKAHWNLESYMVRSATAMDLLLNLIILAYALCKLLPYMDRDFKAWRVRSPQQVRLRVGKLILQRTFLYRMAQDLQIAENRSSLEKAFGRLLVRFAKLF